MKSTCLFLGRESKNFSGNISYYLNVAIPHTEQAMKNGCSGYKVVRVKVDLDKYQLFNNTKVLSQFKAEVVSSTRYAFVDWDKKQSEIIPQTALYEISFDK